MDKIIVRGGNTLTGRVKVSGAKNAVLPIIAASILAKRGVCTIHETPRLDDVFIICEVLKMLGADTTYRHDDETLLIDTSNLHSSVAPADWVRKMRASFLVMGPLLARVGHASIPLPGGCAIGTRPIDQHLKGFEAMGAEIELGQGLIVAKVNGKLQGTKIYLDVPSVGATENIMMAATLAEGTTVIENAAKEPEIVDLANFLNAMGAKVRGAGTGIIRIEGVEELEGCSHTVIPDRIEAGTYMVAAAITGGDIFVEGVIADHLTPVIAKLEETGVMIEQEENGLRVFVENPLKSVDIKTLPYPGFPTDMQAQMMSLMLCTEGTSIMTETVFENRFMHVDELKSMGGKIKVEGRTAIVSGGNKLTGSKVCAPDLRAGAGLILAGLTADGATEITGVQHIDRGYVDIVNKLKMLGADIERLVEEKVSDVEKQPQLLSVRPSWA